MSDDLKTRTSLETSQYNNRLPFPIPCPKCDFKTEFISTARRHWITHESEAIQAKELAKVFDVWTICPEAINIDFHQAQIKITFRDKSVLLVTAVCGAERLCAELVMKVQDAKNA